MGLYLGKDKISALRTIEKTVPSMKAYLEAGGKCGYNNAVSFEGCWLVSDWENVNDCSRMFYNCSIITSIPNMNTSKVTNMGYMFSNCSRLTSVPAMDTSKVTNMTYMFYYCSSLTSIPSMDTSKVTNMSTMFGACSSLTSIPSMDTSKVTDMSSMFGACSSLTSIPSMDTSKVTDMGYMFSNCSNLESIHMHGTKVSFDISASTKFTREALVEILNNLATVTTSPTLTMGSRNLAKLTDADKAIATGKGWKLA